MSIDDMAGAAVVECLARLLTPRFVSVLAKDVEGLAAFALKEHDYTPKASSPHVAVARSWTDESRVRVHDAVKEAVATLQAMVRLRHKHGARPLAHGCCAARRTAARGMASPTVGMPACLSRHGPAKRRLPRPPQPLPTRQWRMPATPRPRHSRRRRCPSLRTMRCPRTRLLPLLPLRPRTQPRPRRALARTRPQARTLRTRR